MKIITAPEEYQLRSDEISVFLAGGITNCWNWQQSVLTQLSSSSYLTDRLVVFNPRQDNFPIDDPNASRSQIEWEFKYLNQSNIFSMYFTSGQSTQPICMYELGRYLEVNKLIHPSNSIISVESGYVRENDVIIQSELALGRDIVNRNATSRSHGKLIYEAYLDLLDDLSDYNFFSEMCAEPEEEQPKMLCLGDSITSGENNDFVSFVDKLRWNNSWLVDKVGVSGACIGDYSIYPVEHKSLLNSLYEIGSDKLSSYNAIFIEYGVNDITSLLLSGVSEVTIKLEFRKCIDYIRQNSQAKIIFIALSNEVAQAEAIGQFDYLHEDYLKGYDDDFIRCSKGSFIDMWADGYRALVDNWVKKFVDDIYYIRRMHFPFDKDKMHPSDDGYQQIAASLEKYIIEEELDRC